ncbi:coiled-coil domain-containing protein 134-like [Ceratina calcarata]|uniref:Coiled-coil domain-containing protein 134-like n=1 Tax=Ceratina calcarata TaxID=156304 RepID=A0AAJ7JHW2_9HYME|nr:coiled-coil domain-containing protein 134-like [Ceratina calcarata]XP_026666529.1 coiled-coil domain-containing protein 134-like [Ceratina calcarata]
MPRVLICIAVVSVLTCIAHAQHVSPSAGAQKVGAKSENGSSNPKVYEELFKKTFGNQRKEHTEAIKRLQKIDSYERLYKMIMVLGEKMIDVIQSSKEMIENVGFDPTNRSLPQNVTIQSAISTTLENTALFGDILLHFPHITHRILRTQQKWNPVISWSLNFTYRTRHLLDKDTFDKIHLASQELNVIKREQGYFNPYWQSTESQKGDKEKTKKKKSTKKRGPQITKIEL